MFRANENVSTLCGHLTIKRVFGNGIEECIFDDHNIIVSGLGLSIGEAMTADKDAVLDRFMVDRFQLGVGSTEENAESSSLSVLFDPLKNEYGPSANSYVGDQLVNGYKKANQYFGKIDKSRTRRDGNTSVTYTLVIDETMANNVTREGKYVPLNEVGLFVKDPTNNEMSVMVAYRQFTDVIKTSDFSLVLTWTISFLDNVDVDQFTSHVFDLDYQMSDPLATMLFMNWLGVPDTDTVSGMPAPGGDLAYNSTEVSGGSNGYGAWRLGTYLNEVFPSIVAYDCGVIPPVTPYLDPLADPSAFQYVTASGLNSAGNLPAIKDYHPSDCGNYYEYMNTTDTSIQRNLWSFLRPHNGIYSSSLKNKESIERFGLATKILKASPGKNYGFDAFCPVIQNTYYSTRNMTDTGKIVEIAEIRHHSFLNQIAYCEDNNLSSCVIPHFEFELFYDRALSEGMPHEEIMKEIREEIRFYSEKAIKSSSGFKINGRQVIRFFGAVLPSGPFRVPGVGETWDDVNSDLRVFFDELRKELGNDFYAIKTGGNAQSLGAWDGIQKLPAIMDYSAIVQPAGSLDFTDPSAAYGLYINDSNVLDLSSKLASGDYPGRIGGLITIPGFTDIGQKFGQGVKREVPRQEETIRACFSALEEIKVNCPQMKTVHALSWDDVVEGHCFWPTVSGQGPSTFGAYNIGPSGTWALNTFDEEFKNFKGETYDPAATCPSALFLDYDTIRGCPY